MCLHCILERGDILVYFTRTPQKGRGGGRGGSREEEVEEEECQLLFKVVRLFSVWLKAQWTGLFYFFYSLKQQGRVMFSLWDRGQKKGTFCQVFRVEPVVQHHQRRARGGNKEVFIFCMKEFLSGPAPAAWSLSTDFKSFSGGAHVTCTGSQCGTIQ